MKVSKYISVQGRNQQQHRSRYESQPSVGDQVLQRDAITLEDDKLSVPFNSVTFSRFCNKGMVRQRRLRVRDAGELTFLRGHEDRLKWIGHVPVAVLCKNRHAQHRSCDEGVEQVTIMSCSGPI